VNADPGGWDGSINEPWVGEKGMLSEGGLRVPMVLSWQGVLPSAVYDKPVSSLDFASTAVAAAGLPADPALDGVDMVPYLTGRNAAEPHGSLCWRFWTQAAIREGRWKYLSAGSAGEFLFDLGSDAGERRNVISENRARADSMRVKLGNWTKRFDPPGIPEGPCNSQEKSWFKHYFHTSP
jgi:arylsulfatase A-like enzyme